MAKALKILWYAFLAAVTLLALCLILLQIPRIQSAVICKVTDVMEAKLFDADISMEKIHVRPFRTLVVRKLAVVDRQPCRVDTTQKFKPGICEKFRQIGTAPVDTLFRADYLIVKFSLRGLFSSSITIDEAFIKNAAMTLVLEDDALMNTNLTRMFRLPKKSVKPEGKDKEIFVIRNISVDNIRYCMKSYNSKTPAMKEGGINWNDLDVRNITIRGRNLRMRGRVMTGELDHLSFEEKSGYRVYNLSGRTRVGKGMALIEELRLQDPWSDIYIPHYSMHFRHSMDFADYVNKIKMEAKIEPSSLSFTTLGYFAPGLTGNSLLLDIHGEAVGRVNGFEITGLHFATPDGEVSGKITGSLSGIVDKEEKQIGERDGKIRVKAGISDFNFTGAGLESIVRACVPQSKIKISKYAEDVRFKAEMNASGTLEDIRASAGVSSEIGSVSAELQILNLVDKTKVSEIDARINSDNLNIHEIIEGIPVKETTLEADLSISLHGDKAQNSIDIRSLKVNRLNFNGYDYNSILAAGKLADNHFDGRVMCSDPNLNFIFQGIFAFSNKTNNSLYRFYANVGYADLYALNFDRRGKSRVVFQSSADFTRTGEGNILGGVNVADIMLENSSDKFDIGDISLSSFTGNGIYRIKFASQFAEGSYTGSAGVGRFIRDLKGLTLKKEVPALFRDGAYVFEGEEYELSFKALKSFDLLSFAVPGMYIAENSELNLKITGNGIVDGGLKSQRIAFREQYMKDIDLEFSNRKNSLVGELRSESASVADILMKNNHFQIFMDDDHVGVGFSYNNEDSKGNRGEVVAIGGMERGGDGVLKCDISLLPSSINLNTKKWNIYPSEARIRGKEIYVENFQIGSGEQSIHARGGISGQTDTLNVKLEKFDISIINSLIGEKYKVRGLLSGSAKISSPAESRSFLVDMTCDSTELGGERFGSLKIDSRWNHDYRRFDIGASNNLDGKKTFVINGNYSPSLKQIEADVLFDEFSLVYAKPFIDEIFTEVGGRVSGQLVADGVLGDLNIRSEDTRIKDGYLKVAYTNVGYNVDGAFSVNRSGVYFDDMNVSDRHKNAGKVSGKIGYDNFRDIYFDTHLNFNRIEAIDLGAKDSDIFYGNLFAGGNVSITGPVNAIVLSADVSTSREGNIHIPMNASLNAGSTNLLKFKTVEQEEVIDPYELMLKKLDEQKVSSGDFSLNMKVSTNPEVEVFVEIDRESGNTLNARGNGTVELGVKGKDFDIKGDYAIQSGSYHFVALGIVSRNFTINEGSSIKFNGDIMDSSLDINASYRTKTSLATLIADTTSVNNRRIVDCDVRITDKLSSPRLAFSINVPDIDPIVKSKVESALSTEDKIQKQFLSLLVSNNFLPDEQSGISNNSSALYSSVSEIMSNQFNNILQKLEIPIDLGLNYQQDSKGTDIFDVAVSTQLFNNRIIVNGNIGNRQYRSGSSENSNIIGDLDIEIKLDRPGAFRLNLFSHSADQYTNYLDDSQRNGVGITYQQEFNRFGELMKRLFMSRKKKEALEMEEMEAARNEEKVTFEISPPK